MGAAAEVQLGEARRLQRGLDVHSPVHHVGDELGVGLRLVEPSHDAEADMDVALLQEPGDDGVKRPLARGQRVGTLRVEIEQPAAIVQMKAAAVRRSAKEKAQAEELAKQFDGVSVTFTRKSGEHDQLFGSVTSSDLADGLVKKGFNVDRRKIQLHEPLKSLGEFTVPVKLHKDVTAHLKVVIEKEAVE